MQIVSELPVSRIDRGHLFTCLSAVALVVPFTTGCLPWHFNHGWSTISPTVYMPLAAVVVLGNLFLYKPRASWSMLLLVFLIALRLLDDVVLSRQVSSNQVSNTTTIISALLLSVVLCLLIGDEVGTRLSAFACAGLTLIVCVAMNAWEWQNPGAFSTTEGRSAGWLGNANESATTICLMLGLLLALRPPLWLSTAAIVGSGAGVYFTLSRGGFLIWAFVSLAYVVSAVRRGIHYFIAVVLLLAGTGLFLVSTVNFQGIDKGHVKEREQLLWGKSNMRLDNNRLDPFLEGVEGIKREPLAGYGIGAAIGAPFSPHNQFLACWLEQGILGIGLFVTALVLLVREILARDRFLLIAAIPLLAANLFHHDLLDDRSYLFVWLFVAGLAHLRGQRKALPAGQPCASPPPGFSAEFVNARPVTRATP